MKIEELESYLGYIKYNSTDVYGRNYDNTPTWVYQSFGERQNGVYGYWLMDANSSENQSRMWYMDYDGMVNTGNISGTGKGVRPVINLLKSAIE